MRRIVAILVLVAASAPLVPASAAEGIGQFVLRCRYSHSNMDDPIVFPGRPGASHMHDFFGNTSVDAHSTLESMLEGDTTCRVPSDTAGYWTPTAFLNGARIEPTVMRIYYLGPRVGPVRSFPPGLQIIGGNRDAETPEANPHVAWYCGATKDVKTPRMGEPYDCTPWSSHTFVDGVIAIVDLPSCWNGTGLRPDDVTYRVNGRCPSDFPYSLPEISERIHYGIMNPLNPDGTVALTLSSGPTYTLHADFWNTWQQDRLDELVTDCIAARVHCGSVDATSRVEWTQQFGTTRYDLAHASAPDGEGGSYVAGFTNLALPGQRYRHGYDAFLRRYDSEGNELWTRQFGTNRDDRALAVSVAGDAVYVVGATEGRFPKEDASGGLDAFVVRFDAEGNQVWLRQLGTRRDDEILGAAATGSAVFVVGTTEGRLTGARSEGGADAFLLRISAGGGEVWARQFGSRGADGAAAVAVRNGVVAVAGSTEDPDGTSDAVVVTFGTDGRKGWRRMISTVASEAATSVVMRSESVFLAGWTIGTLSEQSAAGGRDSFVAKLGSDGQVTWLRQFGSEDDDDAAALFSQGKGLYVAGSTTGEMPDGTSLGETDAFLRRYGPGSGSAIWTMQLGTAGDDRVYGMSGDRHGVVMVGTTTAAWDGFANAGDRDVFAIRVAFT